MTTATRLTLTYGELPDFGTFQRMFDAACPTGCLAVRAGLSGLFAGTPFALTHGEENAYNCLTTYRLLEACVAAAAEQDKAEAEEQEALPTVKPGLDWPTCLSDAADVLQTLGVEWV